MDSEKIHMLVNSSWSRIRPYVLYTPLMQDFKLSKGSTKVYFKLESEQETGSFKLRGAFSKLLSLKSIHAGSKKSIITASTGNHGLACVTAMRRLDMTGQIVVPVHANEAKLANLEDRGANVLKIGQDCHEGEAYARNVGDTDPHVDYVSPYNDPEIIGGQGTIGREIMEQLEDREGCKPEVVFVSVGGGGLISGIAGYLKHEHPDVKIVGCQPKASAGMLASIQAGKIVEVDSTPTLSDGTAGDIDFDSITFEPCRDLVDEWVLVDEEPIAQAMNYMLKEHRKVVEGAAGLALASYWQTEEKYQGKNIVIVLCGGNVDWNTIKKISQLYHA